MRRVGARGAALVGALALTGLTIVWSPRLDSEAPVSQLATAAADDRVGELIPSASTVPTTSPSPTIAPPPTSSPPPPASSSVAPATTRRPVATTTAPVPSTLAQPVNGSSVDVGAEALGLLQYDWQGRFSDWSVDFLGPRDGLRALTYPRERRIEVFVRPSDSAESVHRVLAHEIGHMIDVEINSDADRDRWRRQRGLGDSVSWWPNESDPDFATGAGDFAEAFAVLETGVTSHSTVAGQPTPADLALVTALAADR